MKNQIKRHKGLVIAITVIAAAVVAATAAAHSSEGEKQETKDSRQNTISLSKMDLTNSVSATGTLESARVKTVSAGITNVMIKKVNVSEGDEVVKGQKLVTFDESGLRESLDEAKENLSDTREQNDTELASANRKLTEARETYSSQKKEYAANAAAAEKEYKAAKKAVSAAGSATERQKAEQSLEQAQKSYEQAKSEQENGNRQNKNSVQTAEDQLASAKNSSKKSLREAQRQVSEAEKALENCSVTAPMSGTVTAIGAESGENYNGGALVEISDCSELQVSTTVDEYDIPKVETGQKVVILTDATGDTELQGSITYTAKTTGSSLSDSSSAGAGSVSASGNGSSSGSSSGYEVRIKLNTQNDKLRIGMTAKCSIVLQEAEDVFAVPYDAVHTNADGETVLYVMDHTGGRSEVAVTKGMESDYYVEVSGEGLSENLQVIIPADETDTSESDTDEGSLDGLMGGGMKGGMRGGNHGNPGGPDGVPGGAPGM